MVDQIQVANSATQLDGKTLLTAEDFQEIGGEKTFVRAPAAPFVVEAGSGKVANLDADKLDGEEGAGFHNASNLNSGTLPAERFPSALPAVSAENLTNIPAPNLTGEIPATAVPDPLPAVSAENLTDLPAANLVGSVPSAALTSVPAANLTGTVPGASIPDPLPAVSGANLKSVSRLASVQYSDAATSGTTETQLHSFDVPAEALAIGQAIHLEAWGTTDGNANNKTIRVYVGTIVLAFAASTTTQNWRLIVDIIRTGTATVAISACKLLSGGSSNALLPDDVTGAVTWSSAVTIKTTGQNATSGLFTEKGMVAQRIA